MGIVYKTTQEVIKRILDLKSNDQKLAVRRIAEIVSKEFGEKISKSTVNNVLKQERLSSPVGRRLTNGNTNIVEKMALDEAPGIYIMNLFNKALGADRLIADTILNSSGAGISFKEADVLSGMMFGLAFQGFFGDQPLTVERLAFYRQASGGADIGPDSIDSLLIRSLEGLCVNAEAGKGLSDKLFSLSREAGSLELSLSDGRSLFIDAGLNTVWPDMNIPEIFSSLFFPLKRYVSASLLNGDEPFIILTAPGVREISPELADLIFACDSPDLLSVKGACLTGSGRDHFREEIVLPSRKHGFIVALPQVSGASPQGFLKENKRVFNMLFGPYNERISLSDGSCVIVTKRRPDPFILRAVFLRRERGGMAVALLTNISENEAKREDIARSYMARYPDFGGSIEDLISQTEHFLADPDKILALNGFGTGEENIDLGFESLLRSWVRFIAGCCGKYVFPEGYMDVSDDDILRMILGLKGYALNRQGYMVVKFLSEQPCLRQTGDITAIVKKLNKLAGIWGADKMWFERV